MISTARKVSIHLITLSFIGSASVYAATTPKPPEPLEIPSVSTTLRQISLKAQITDENKENAQPAITALTTQKPLYTLRGIGLFSGTDVFSKAIRTATKSNYSHVGVILTPVDADPNDESQWFCFESTGSANEILKKHKAPHVRVTPWEDVVANYGGGVAFRTFEFEKGHEPSAVTITDFVNRFDGRPYQKNLIKLALAVPAINSRPTLKSVFCSELAAQLLIESGYLTGYWSNNYVPRHFSSEYKRLGLMGAKLSRETIVKHKPHIGIAA